MVGPPAVGFIRGLLKSCLTRAGLLMEAATVRERSFEICDGISEMPDLGWLLGVQRESVGDGQLEPPVSAGLRDLSPALTSLAEFLDIDSDLLEVAAELSADRELSAPSSEMLSAWIAALPEREKNSLLFQVASGKDPHVGADLMRRIERGAPEDGRSSVTREPDGR
jgi:hypothetical protein